MSPAFRWCPISLIIVASVMALPGLTLVNAAVEVYPVPEGESAAEGYRVQVDGKDVFVHDSPVGAIACFSFEGTIEVVVAPKHDVKAVDVRPRSRDVKWSLKDNVIRFGLAGPGNFSIEINHDIKRPLFLFANPLEADAPRPGTVGVRYLEGGKVHVPGVVELYDDETVYIAGGAVVHGVIRARNARHIKVCGRGILDGTRMREFTRSSRLRFVQLDECTDVDLEGIILRNSQTWQIVPILSDNISIANVKILSGNGSDDGIDIVRSRNVRIRDCFIRTKDDCIAIKSVGDSSDRGTRNIEVSDCVLWNAEWGNALEIGFELRTEEVRDIVLRNCDVIHVEDGATFSIHDADYATVGNVRFEKIRVEDARQKLIDLAIFLSQYSVDRPADPEERQRRYMHGAWDGVLTVPQDLMTEHAKHRGHIKDVVFKGVYITDGLFPFSVICGFDGEHKVENVVIGGLWVHDRKITSAEQGRFYIENAESVVFRD